MLANQIRYFVRSWYKRGRDYAGIGVREAFIISHYHTIKEAETHFNRIPADPYRFLYDANNPVHAKRLQRAAGTREYKVFSRLIIPGIEKKASRRYAKQTTLFLFRNTQWNFEPRGTVNPELFIEQGELYARIAYRGNEIKVKFEDIENTR
jgi:hypothetical protein